MKELEEIVKAFDHARMSGKQTALATVVHIEGSSYRRAGARMLITEDGQLTGAISGGCLEGDALRKARLVMMQQSSMLVTYDTTDEDDVTLGVGLGCNGIIHILIEPIDDEQKDNPITFFKVFLSKREPVILITLFNMTDRSAPQYGTTLLFDQQANTLGTLPEGALHEAIVAEAARVLQNGNTATKTYHYQEDFTCFIELLQPAISLVIVGAGNDAIPLALMAKVLGYQVTIVDGRANYGTSVRFPTADKLIVAKPADVKEKILIDDRTVFMLMTHNYNYDLALLAELLKINLSYIGVLGPKKRLARLLDEIAFDPALPKDVPDQVYGPAGLDIGSENAEEIALAILSEIQSVLNKRNGTSLRTKQVIHERNNDQGSRQLQATVNR